MVNIEERRRKETAYTKFHYGKMKLDQKECAKALHYFTKAIELDDKIDEIYYWRGRAHNESQNWEAARNDLTKAIDLKQNFALAYNERGYSSEKLRLFQESIQDYTKAIELKPNDWGIYENRAYVYKAMLDWKSALEDYNQALALGAKDAETRMYRGVVLGKLGRFQDSITDLTESIRINKSLGTAYFFRAQTYTDMGQYDLAANDYRSLLQIKPGHDVAYNNLAFVCNIIGNYHESITSATISMDLCHKYNKSAARSYAHRGFAHTMLGNLSQAFLDCETSVQLEPEGYARGYCHRAFVYYHMSRIQDCIQDCNKAIEMGGQDMTDAYFIRGMASLEKSDFIYCKNNKHCLKVFSIENVEKELKKMSFVVTYEEETKSVTVDCTSVQMLAQNVAKEFVGMDVVKSANGMFKLRVGKVAADNSMVFSDVSNVEQIMGSDVRLVYVCTPKKRHSDVFEEHSKKYNRSIL